MLALQLDSSKTTGQPEKLHRGPSLETHIGLVWPLILSRGVDILEGQLSPVELLVHLRV